MFVPHRPYWIVSTGGEINSEDLEKLVKKKKKKKAQRKFISLTQN